MYFISVSVLVTVSIRLVQSLRFFGYNYHHDELILDNEDPGGANVSKEWFDQPLDHFSETNKTWKMKYYKRLDLWKSNGPIYLYLAGEGPLYESTLKSNTFLAGALAVETNGALFSAEHRYYGDSLPVNITNVSSLKYFSSKQALADFAALIKFIKSNPEFKSSKVVTVGGSYAGNLAAWMRVRYPGLVDAAIACSAPVLAKKDFYESMETVSYVYETYGTPECGDIIKKRFDRYVELMKTPSGIETLKKENYICESSDMSIPENRQFFFFNKFATFLNGAQMKHPDEIKLHCQQQKTNNWQQTMTKVEEGCYPNNFTLLIENTKSKPLSGNLWMYQYCNEFGYFQTTTSHNQLFGFNTTSVEFHAKLCEGVFGKDFTEERIDTKIAETNGMYGGNTPNVTNVIFTNGDMDPWHRLGVVKDLSDSVVAITTNGTTHCTIMSYNKDEPVTLTQDRERAKSLIKKWIGH